MHNKNILQRRYTCQTMFEELEIRNVLAKSILPSSHNIIYMDLAKIVYGNITDLVAIFSILCIREGCKKSKWKFKMAFAMKGGGSRGGLFCH